jgi:hypothetical protein
MFLRHLCAGLALAAVLLVSGCHSCGTCRRGVVATAPCATPGCPTCGPGAPPGAVIPPPPAPIGGAPPPGAFGTSANGGLGQPR